MQYIQMIAKNEYIFLHLINESGQKVRVICWSQWMDLFPSNVFNGNKMKLFDVKNRTDSRSREFQKDAIATVAFCESTKVEVIIKLLSIKICY